ncbi:hypothetical protein RND81_04G034200 [Saponaria officinalis]|uniref:F-box domain-containing protein n=1 Tax=Saponaria officinalis TaxID=3572 RepID=A0AAW1LHI1_SAPOF
MWSPRQPPPYCSASVVGSNDDLLTEILSHLQVKPLLRFKSVNKQWHSTISHPSFSLLHSLRHPHPPPSALYLLLHLPSSFPGFTSISLSSLRRPPPLPPPPFDIVQSSNGLFLSLSPLPSPYLHVLVSNPTTRSNTRIFLGSKNPISGSNPSSQALSGSGQGSDRFVGSGLGLSQVQLTGSVQDQVQAGGSGQGQVEVDGSIWWKVRLAGSGQEQMQVVGVSLGFDPGRWAHYYVIRVFRNGSDRFLMDVYDSGTGMWRDATVYLDEAPFDTEFDRGVYWEGRVFWLSHTGNMVYYDIENDVIGKLVLPKVFEQGSYLERFRYFGESCGHLHLIEIRTNCVREFDVLELEETEGGNLEWFVKYRVDLDLVGCEFEDDMFQDGVDRFGRRLRFYAFSILAVIRGIADEGNGDDEGFAELVLSIPGKVISYNFEKKISRLMCNVVDESDKWFPFRGYNAFQFIESLYCP